MQVFMKNINLIPQEYMVRVHNIINNIDSAFVESSWLLFKDTLKKRRIVSILHLWTRVNGPTVGGGH